MPSARVLRGIAYNSLDTYVSRYSSYNGYWLFGFLVGSLSHVDFDLLAPQGPSGTPLEAAQARAVHVFREQLAKAGLEIARIRNARLTLQRGRVANVVTEDFSTSGWEVLVSLHAEASTGRVFHAERVVCVAAHNPNVERRTAGAA